MHDSTKSTSNEVAARCYSDRWLSRSDTSPIRKGHMKAAEKPCSWDSSLGVVRNATNKVPCLAVQQIRDDKVNGEGGESENGTRIAFCADASGHWVNGRSLQHVATTRCLHSQQVLCLFGWRDRERRKKNGLDFKSKTVAQWNKAPGKCLYHSCQFHMKRCSRQLHVYVYVGQWASRITFVMLKTIPGSLISGAILPLWIPCQTKGHATFFQLQMSSPISASPRWPTTLLFTKELQVTQHHGSQGSASILLSHPNV